MSDFILFLRKGPDLFEPLSKPYPSYRAAVEAGFDLGGPRNFYVECDHVPSREEQLLEEVKPARVSRVDKMLKLLDI